VSHHRSCFLVWLRPFARGESFALASRGNDEFGWGDPRYWIISS